MSDPYSDPYYNRYSLSAEGVHYRRTSSVESEKPSFRKSYIQISDETLKLEYHAYRLNNDPYSHAEKVSNKLHEILPLLDMCKVACILDSDPFDLWNQPEEGFHAQILYLIINTIDQKGHCFDLVNLVHDSPVPQRTRYSSSRRTNRPVLDYYFRRTHWHPVLLVSLTFDVFIMTCSHRCIYRRILVQPLQCRCKIRSRPRFHLTCVPFRIRQESCLILCSICPFVPLAPI